MYLRLTTGDLVELNLSGRRRRGLAQQLPITIKPTYDKNIPGIVENYPHPSHIHTTPPTDLGSADAHRKLCSFTFHPLSPATEGSRGTEPLGSQGVERTPHLYWCSADMSAAIVRHHQYK